MLLLLVDFYHSLTSFGKSTLYSIIQPINQKVLGILIRNNFCTYYLSKKLGTYHLTLQYILHISTYLFTGQCLYTYFHCILYIPKNIHYVLKGQSWEHCIFETTIIRFPITRHNNRPELCECNFTTSVNSFSPFLKPF